MKKKVKKKTSIKKIWYTYILVLIVSVSFTTVFAKSTLSKYNFEVERQKKEIERQKKKNESLTMAINELASLNKIREVAQQQGLRYNNNNIKRLDQ